MAVIEKIHEGLTKALGLDMSDQLVTDCVNIVDKNKLKHIPWEELARAEAWKWSLSSRTGSGRKMRTVS